jgi:hypothetical protein
MLHRCQKFRITSIRDSQSYEKIPVRGFFHGASDATKHEQAPTSLLGRLGNLRQVLSSNRNNLSDTAEQITNVGCVMNVERITVVQEALRETAKRVPE